MTGWMLALAVPVVFLFWSSRVIRRRTPPPGRHSGPRMDDASRNTPGGLGGGGL